MFKFDLNSLFTKVMKFDTKWSNFFHAFFLTIIWANINYSLEFVLSAMIGVLVYWYRNNQDVSRDKSMLLMANFTNSGVKGIITS
jgi:hypothetical protein